ncbi:LacI family transcriptional regulator [Puniceicoccales bacterium CK1056]|uniref:LacI family transcriptional regulator n=1 Tax=Oceanipulchritudo coccoides TaxID=2706888 RepID=A0A6B2M0K0_9BACT|nr:LacI family DNA-binding transcriptional regulator [Oceanipulchritudo coccoides]NDV61876.1 LacI family transcriptional regulator [Oceanipulchritudo coccoides]
MRKSNSKRTTIKDVAEAAGVSTAAVSQALRPKENSNIKLQETKIQLIRETAKKLNYRPHTGARSIRSQRFGSIGYFSSKSLNLVYTPYGYQHGVHDALEESDFRLTLIRVSAGVDQASEEIPKAFSEFHLDGLIVESYSELASKLHDLYADRDFPFLYLNDRHEFDSVFVGEIEASKVLTNHVISKGYRKIAFAHRYIKGEPVIEKMHHSALDRETGYRQTMSANGLNPTVVTVESPAVLGREVNLTDEQWEQLKEFDAIIAYDDDFANCIARKCYDKGIRIPDDIGLAGFNGDYASLSSWRALTTMQIPAYEMGLTLGRMAVNRIKGDAGKLPSVRFVPSLIQGNTI